MSERPLKVKKSVKVLNITVSYVNTQEIDFNKETISNLYIGNQDEKFSFFKQI